jgi:hypothetical protein
MLFPACTGFGAAELVTTMFAVFAAATSVTTVAVLFARFGSFDPEETESVSVIWVPLTVTGDTCTTKVKVPDAPFATSGFVQLMFPPAPTAGVVHVQPAAAISDWNVVLPGIASPKEALIASSGPLLVTICV